MYRIHLERANMSVCFILYVDHLHLFNVEFNSHRNLDKFWHNEKSLLSERHCCVSLNK